MKKVGGQDGTGRWKAEKRGGVELRGAFRCKKY